MSSTLQVKFSPLKNGELNPDDLHDNNFKGRSKKILKISAVIAHVILCAIIIGFVWYLYIKQNALEGALRDITYIRK